MKRMKRPETPQKLFTQVMDAARPAILKVWEEADQLVTEKGFQCPEDIVHDDKIGLSFYQCNPHFWQCFWKGGIQENPELEIDIFGQTFHLEALADFEGRYYELFKRQNAGLNLHYGYVVKLRVKEIPGMTQTLILGDTCRDTYLPQRIYGYGKVKDQRQEGFIWDNFDRDIFLDKFYVTNRRVNEWRQLSGQSEKIEKDPKKWPLPALLKREEQIQYCAFYGKRLLEAKLFDAASMTPSDTKDPRPKMVYRPDTPWQRDLSKSFLGMARINPDYQLTPLDCQLAQVQGCNEKYFSTDSATWMGFHFSLGFYPESLQNFIEPSNNLKMSSRFLSPASSWHELGLYTTWDGNQSSRNPVAFRCYEEVSK